MYLPLRKSHIFLYFTGRLHLLSLKGYFCLIQKFWMLSLSRKFSHLTIGVGSYFCACVFDLFFCYILWEDILVPKVPRC